MSKKTIMAIAAMGLISFGGAFGAAWLTKASSQARGSDPNQQTRAAIESGLKAPEPEAVIPVARGPADGNTTRAMTEKQLKSLIYEVREKIREYDSRMESLKVQEERLLMTRESLQKDVEQLNGLQVELAATVAGLKEQRDRLSKSRVEIAKTEKANLTSIAATYDKMDASSASKIFASMCATSTSQKEPGNVKQTGAGFDDAVKILHYMTERTKAKVLAEIVGSEPRLAAMLCERLKQIDEE